MSENLLPITVASASSRRFKIQEDGIPGSSHTVKAKNSMMNLTLRKASKIETDEASQTAHGWTMVGLVFFTNFLVLGFFKSLGILTKILSKEFSATMNVYVLMCIAYSLNCVAGPLACYLIRIYSAKNIAIVGTSLVSFGLMMSWFGNSLAFLYLSIGTFVGIGSGLTYPTGVILVGNYFIGTKNAAFANAFVVSGSPIGGMIMPLVVSWLSELYTSRGAFLAVGCCMLTSVICARFFKSPDEWKNSPNNALDRQESVSDDNQTDTGMNAKECERISASDVDKQENNNETTNNLVDRNENILEGNERLTLAKLGSGTGVYKLFEREDDDESARKVTGETSLESFCEQSHHHHHHHHPDQPLAIGSKIGSGTKSVFLSGTGQTVHDRKAGDAEANNIYLRPFGKKCDSDFKGIQRMVVGSFPGLECFQKSSTMNNGMGVGVFSDNEMVCHSLNEDNDIIVNRAEVNINYTLQSRKSTNLGNTTPIHSNPYVLALDHSCVILCSKTDVKRPGTTQPTLFQRHEHLSVSHLHNAGAGKEGGDDEEPAVKHENRSYWKMTKDWVMASPLRNSTYVFLLISNMSTAISTTNIHLMIAQLVEDSGTGEYTKSSMIYLLMAFADLTGRLLGAFLTDKKFIPASVIYGVGLLCAGISSSLFATYSSFNLLCLGGLVFGLSSGLHVGIYGLLLTNSVGLEKIHLGYGISMCINGSLQCIAILLSGKTISKYRNGFVWLSPLLGGILVIGGVIWCLALIIFHAGLENNNARRSEDESESIE